MRTAIVDDASLLRPQPMNDGEASRLVRRLFGRGSVRRRGRACIVGVRLKRGCRDVLELGVGATWEKAFDAALLNAGR